jgi:hypothetical protein
VSRRSAGEASARHGGEPGQALGHAWCWLASHARVRSLVGSRRCRVASPTRPRLYPGPFPDFGTPGSPRRRRRSRGAGTRFRLGAKTPHAVSSAARGGSAVVLPSASRVSGSWVLSTTPKCAEGKELSAIGLTGLAVAKRPSPSGRLPLPRPSSPSTRCRSRSAASSPRGRGPRAARSSTVRRAIRDELDGAQVGCTAPPGARSRVASPPQASSSASDLSGGVGTHSQRVEARAERAESEGSNAAPRRSQGRATSRAATFARRT